MKKNIFLTLLFGVAMSRRVTFLNELSSAEDAALLPKGSKFGVVY